MTRHAIRLKTFLVLASLSLLSVAGMAQPKPEQAGVVIMHGKGGSPNRHVSDLATGLQQRGFKVANLEMPWSGRRDYDVDVVAGEKEIIAALQAMRDKGAKKLFVAGHSQGGIFALHFATAQPVDGVVAIAPGGNTGGKGFREHIEAPLAEARQLIQEGKGNEKARLSDYETSRGNYPLVTTPAHYVDWFAPDGAMNQVKASRNLSAGIPVLYIGPSRDYPGLQANKRQMFAALPPNALTRLYEPPATHLEAPRASIDEIAQWMLTVMAQQEAPSQNVSPSAATDQK